jgi:hypothetical protein
MLICLKSAIQFGYAIALIFMKMRMNLSGQLNKGGFYIEIFDCLEGRFVSYVNNFEHSLKI